MTDRMSNERIAELAAENNGLVECTLDPAGANIALRQTRADLADLRDAVMRNIPMDHLQRHDVPGATGPTAALNIKAAMADYAEERWEQRNRLIKVSTDLAHAKATIAERDAENARLRGLLWFAYHEFTAIRARDGAPDGLCEKYWGGVTDIFANAIGEAALTPWPSDEAASVMALLKEPEHD